MTLQGEGEFLILPEGLAAKVEGQVSVAVEDVSVTGNLELEINTTGSPIEENYEITNITGSPGEENYEISRTSKTMELSKGPYLQIRGNQVNMEIVEQQLTGNFIFERAADGTIQVNISDAELTLKGNDTEFVKITNGKGTMRIDDDGIVGALTADAKLTIPGVRHTSASFRT